MAKAARPLVEEQAAESTDLVVMATVNPLEIFTDREKFSQFYQRVKEETDGHVADVNTEKGRKAIKSLAFRVTKAKTALERAGKDLVEEWRQKVNVVTSARVQMVTELAALADEVRRPLTEWEEAEAARVERCRVVIANIKTAAAVSLEDTSETVRARGKALWETEIGDELGDMADEALEAKATAIATLQRAVERLTKEEEDRAELARLRAEAAEREEREAREREEREQAERDRIAAEQEEERRKEAAEAEAQRIRDAEERAANEAREAEAARAREAEAERQRLHAEQLAESERQRVAAEEARAAAEQEAQAERERVAEAARRREAEEQRERDEQAARDMDREHRAQVIATAAEAIIKVGVTKKLAENVVRAIIAGEIPAISLRF